MKYADGPTTEVQIDIDAPPARVWELVCDVDLPARFSSEFMGAEWLDGATEAAIGARFKGRNKHAAVGEWETTSTIVAFEPERLLEWAVSDVETPSSSWRFVIEPNGAGTKLKQWVRMGPGWSGLNPAIEAQPDKEERIIKRRLEQHRGNMTACLEGIKALAEGRDG